MPFKKILFAGLGGAGQRHLRIFQEQLPDSTEFIAYRVKNSTPLLNPDFSVVSDDNLENKYGLRSYTDFNEALNCRPDLIVISNPTSLHFDIALEAARQRINIFMEKPFSHNLQGYTHFCETVKQTSVLFYISFQRRFHKYIKVVKELISSGKLGKIVSANVSVSSYVPNWHPFEDFHDLYACRKDLGGGALLTEIHEIDLCYHFFGMPEKVYCRGGNYSQFKLDIEDSADIILSYPFFNVNLSIGFMRQPSKRVISIAGIKGSLECDLDKCTLDVTYHNNDDAMHLSDENYNMNDMFYEQAEYFLNEFGIVDVASQLDTAYSSLAIVEASKKSMQKGCEIGL